MIFNSQGDAKLRQFINGGTITPGSEAIVLPKGAQLLGELTIEAVPEPHTETKSVTPGATEQIITPSAGKSLSQVTVAGDADLVPENIADGVDIFGILGTHTGGVTGIDFGEVTLSSTAQTVTVNHNLGVVPSFVALIPVSYAYQSWTSYFNINGYVGYYSSSTRITMAHIPNNATSTQIKFNAYNSVNPFKATTYKWIAIA